jgi:hypothetical protein
MYVPYYMAIALCFPIQRSDRNFKSQSDRVFESLISKLTAIAPITIKQIAVLKFNDFLK